MRKVDEILTKYGAAEIITRDGHLEYEEIPHTSELKRELCEVLLEEVNDVIKAFFGKSEQIKSGDISSTPDSALGSEE